MLLIESNIFLGLAIFFAVIIGIFGFYLPYWKQRDSYRKWLDCKISKDNMFWVVDLTICGLIIQAWRTPYGKKDGIRRINLWLHTYPRKDELGER